MEGGTKRGKREKQKSHRAKFTTILRILQFILSARGNRGKILSTSPGHIWVLKRDSGCCVEDGLEAHRVEMGPVVRRPWNNMQTGLGE